ncbi:MAG: ABC transporter permease [Clostridia bacterium]|nr:ABC transporter permease [Clostridia bacterium]
MNIFKSPKFSAFIEEKAKPFLVKQKKELAKNTNIVIELVKRGIKLQYRNSAIGVIWTILNPLLNMFVMYIVFGTILKYNDDKTYLLYLLCGNIIFNTMRGATSQSLTSLVYNRGLLTKNKIAYNVFPLACNLSAIVNFLFSFIALIVVMLIVSIQVPVFSRMIWLTIPMLPALFLFNYGMSLILSALYVFFRDVMHFYNVFLTLWMYFTPIFYKLKNLGSLWQEIVMKLVMKLNPMAHFVEYFRDIIYRVKIGTLHEATVDTSLITLYIIGLSFAIVGTLVFSITKRKFIFSI